MYRRWFLLGLVGSICLACGTWLLAQKTDDQPPRRGNQAAVYSICRSGNIDLLLDSVHGKTWGLRKLENGNASWLPIPRIDSEKEGMQLWQKTSDFNEEVGNKERTLPLDKVLEGRGYVGIPLDRLKAGYLGIEVRIDGKKVYLMLDTGAPVTHLDLERTKHLQLKWKSWGNEEGKGRPATAGSTSYCEITKLEIGGREIGRLIVGGHDTSEINKVLKLYLDPSIDGELGSDVLAKLNAIIDYSTFKLYFRSLEKRGK